MRRWYAMTAIGHDRPGIVADVAELIYECDCNLEDSRMTVLGSEFAVLVLLSGQGDDLDHRLSTACKRVEWEKRLTVFVRPLAGSVDVDVEPRGTMYTCEVTGVDRAGIVAGVARALASLAVNITDLRTELSREPGSGSRIYTMQMTLQVPPEVAPATLRDRLEAVGGELNVDVGLRPR